MLLYLLIKVIVDFVNKENKKLISKETYRGDTIQNMKNITDLTIEQLQKSKLLIDQMTQVLFRRSIDIPMTKELYQIQDLLNNIYSDYADEIDKLDENYHSFI